MCSFYIHVKSRIWITAGNIAAAPWCVTFLIGGQDRAITVICDYKIMNLQNLKNKQIRDIAWKHMSDILIL